MCIHICIYLYLDCKKINFDVHCVQRCNETTTLIIVSSAEKSFDFYFKTNELKTWKVFFSHFKLNSIAWRHYYTKLFMDEKGRITSFVWDFWCSFLFWCSSKPSTFTHPLSYFAFIYWTKREQTLSTCIYIWMDVCNHRRKEEFETCSIYVWM